LRRLVLQLGMPDFGQQDQRGWLRLHRALLPAVCLIAIVRPDG
jgi:hypothetical protein